MDVSLDGYRWSETTEPPCEAFDCHMSLHCKKHYTCCDAFIRYVLADELIDPRNRMTNFKGRHLSQGNSWTMYPEIYVSRERYFMAHKGSEKEWGDPPIFEELR